jgi:D-alanyl-D-alanine carboxypeptidase
VHSHRPQHFRTSLRSIVLLAAFTLATTHAASAEALLLVDADSGKVLQAENATYPWYPASITKLMTAYVTLKAVKEGRITLDTLFTVSPVAASQSPSKMGLKPGTQVTVDNALKMMMVKSANDMAVVLAEGVGGSVDGFSAMMNQNAKRLGMTQTNYVNPNGLPAEGHVTSARDQAILARAIIRDLPEYEYFVHIPSIRYGRRVTQNFNKLIGRYPGADGFKTGFICASGYNLVASATRNGRRLIAVVLGASSGQARSVKAIQLLDRGFASDTLTWLRPSLGTVDNLVPVDASPPDLHDEMCSGKRHRPASDDDDITAGNTSTDGSGQALAFFSTGQTPVLKPSEILAAAPAPSEPIPVYAGPTRTGAALIATVAADVAADDRAAAARHRAKKSHLAAKKPPEAAPDNTGKQAKSAAGKPVKHANARPDATAKTGDKPAASAKPKAAAKPARPTPKPDAKSSNG